MYMGAIPTTGILQTAKAIAKRGQISRAGIAVSTGLIKPPTIGAALSTAVTKAIVPTPTPQVIPAAPTQANPDIYAAMIAALTNKNNPNWQQDAAEDRVVIRSMPDAAPPSSPSWLIPALLAAGLVLVYLARRKG